MENTTNAAAITADQFNEALATAEAALTAPVVNYGDEIAKQNFNDGKELGNIEGFIIGGVTVIAGIAIIKLINKIKAKKVEKQIQNSNIEEVNSDENK